MTAGEVLAIVAFAVVHLSVGVLFARAYTTWSAERYRRDAADARLRREVESIARRERERPMA